MDTPQPLQSQQTHLKRNVSVEKNTIINPYTAPVKDHTSYTFIRKKPFTEPRKFKISPTNTRKEPQPSAAFRRSPQFQMSHSRSIFQYTRRGVKDKQRCLAGTES
ncbi:hypothetical protein BHYA_0004g00250 [Botrytis hyacinthi]|uniref:Uncharacterized protein n=1 Tax=Botrytis hyacinthi TaxID=278943 RepID=A0A4Z1H3C6_9HELO|nr:hypothetical protein BHYA_0004g00250 [Botrytis hyacinthi]